MSRLHELLAVVGGKKSQAASKLTTLYHRLKTPELLKGITRTYRPRDEDGVQLPPESKRVQLHVNETLRAAHCCKAPMWDAVLSVDAGNQTASADITLEGEVLIADVPVCHLLFLEKELVDIHTFITNLPTLDPAHKWERSEEANCWATIPTETVSNKKVPKNHVLTEATKEHPAQVQMYNEDVVAGYWKTVNLSGAISEGVKAAMLYRVCTLQEAVKLARERANTTEVVSRYIGDVLLDYLFGNTD